MHRHGGVGRTWPLVVRGQTVAAAVVLSVVAAWRLSGVAELLWPAMVAAVLGAMLGLSYVLTPEPRRTGLSALRAWAASSNTTYFGIPMAGVLAGPAGVGVAVLVDRLSLPVSSLTMWMLRRDAPVPQRVATSWIDQAPLLAVVAGLLLKLTGPAPEATLTISAIFAPVLAGTGAAVFVGSVLHRSQRIDPRPGITTWLRLVTLRVVLIGPLVVLAPSPAVGVVAALTALSVPTFGPAQMSTVYGYADAAVVAAARYGWVTGAVGLVAAWTVAR